MLMQMKIKMKQNDFDTKFMAIHCLIYGPLSLYILKSTNPNNPFFHILQTAIIIHVVLYLLLTNQKQTYKSMKNYNPKAK